MTVMKLYQNLSINPQKKIKWNDNWSVQFNPSTTFVVLTVVFHRVFPRERRKGEDKLWECQEGRALNLRKSVRKTRTSKEASWVWQWKKRKQTRKKWRQIQTGKWCNFSHTMNNLQMQQNHVQRIFCQKWQISETEYNLNESKPTVIEEFWVGGSTEPPEPDHLHIQVLKGPADKNTRAGACF